MSNKKQLRYDKAYLRIAQEWGKLSHCKRKQVGALIVKDRMIISDGYNGTPTGFENYCVVLFVGFIGSQGNVNRKVADGVNDGQ